MLVPSTRLIRWSGIILVASCLVYLADVSLLLPIAIVLLLFVFVAMTDALRVYGALDNAAVEFPEVIRLTKDREGFVDFLLKRKDSTPATFRLGLDFPPEIVSEHETLIADLPSEASNVQLTWPCRPAKRGNFLVSNLYVDAPSPFGLWSLYATLPAQTTVRVYPNVQKEQKHVAALFLNRGGFGIHAQRQVGKGREFEKLRDYVVGDSYEDIHWKATARRGRPVTKDFQIERTQEVYVIIDASRLSAREMPEADGLGMTNQLERFVSASLVLGMAAQRQGDLFGILSFNDRVREFVRAKGGRAHAGVCRDALYALQPQDVNPDFAEVMTFIRSRLRRRSLLIFLTNLDDPVLSESFVSNMDLIARHHLVMVNMVKPRGVRPVFSDTNVHEIQDIYDQLSGHLQWHALLELKKVLQRRNVTMSLLDHATMTLELVTQYINLKQRQLL